MSERIRLLFDDRYLESSRGLSRAWFQPTKHPQNPVLKSEMPWERGGAFPFLNGFVHRDPTDGYRLWYRGLDERLGKAAVLCYATSTDGISWEKPALGLVEYRGSSENNIVLMGHCWAGPQLFCDEVETDPLRRFKCLNWDLAVRPFDPVLADRIDRWEVLDLQELRYISRTAHEKGLMGAFARYSPDGIHWSANPEMPTCPDRRPDGHWVGFGDTYFVHRDPRLGRFVAYSRCCDPEEGPGYRIIGRSETDDFESWPDPEVILAPDIHDPPGLQFYGLGVWWYGDRYLGLLNPFHHSPDDTRCDVELVWSDDGIHWTRHPERAVFLPTGPVGAWDCGMVYPGNAVVSDDEIRFYYAGANRVHNPPEGHGLGEVVDGQKLEIVTGLARLRLDGFVSLAAGSAGGELLTTPMTAPEGRFFLNVDAKDGWVAAEVVDIFGRPLLDYTFWDCVPLRGVDGTRLELSWKCGKPIAVTGRRSVRLRLYLENARLYAIRYA